MKSTLCTFEITISNIFNVLFQLAFNALSYLWGRRPMKTYGERMTDTMLIIFRHILRGEKTLEVILQNYMDYDDVQSDSF